MNRDEILRLPSMPAASPTYPVDPYRIVNREHFIIVYESDPEAIRAAVPEPLKPAKENLVYCQWVRTPDSLGLGDYTESGLVIPCMYHDMPCNFTAQMYLDDDPPIAAGGAVWGFPRKYAHPKLEAASNTLTGTLDCSGQRVATGTMSHKHGVCACDPSETAATLSKLQVNLRLIPDVDGKHPIAQLIAYHLTDIAVKGSWTGPARLHLVPHVSAPVADLPVRRIIGARHFVADLTLPHGRLLQDYRSMAAWLAVD